MRLVTDKQANASYYGGVFIDEDEIVIDYKLAKEIGATHYRECADNEVDYYKLSDNGLTLLCYSKKCEEWDESSSTGAVVLAKIKPIPPKPRTRTEYEKVTESIFDLRDEFERGELYCKLGDELVPVPNETQLSMLLDHGRCYRRIEKPVNWSEDIYEWQHTAKIGVYTPLDFFVSDLIKSHPDKFLELCRVALRANGEIE